jgi:protein-tyrosine kinase
MGKFYDALRRSGNLKERYPPKSPSNNVVRMPAQPVPGNVRDLAPSETPAESLLARDTGMEPRLISLLDPNASASECYKMLRTKLLVLARERPLKAIMVTSAEPSDGKSLTAANIAVSIAQGVNDHVLLVDCDLRAPTLHKSFDISPEPGCQGYLEEGTPLASCLVKTPLKRLTVLPGGRPSSNFSELLCSQKMRALVEELKSRYDDRFVIFDSPPGQFAAETAFLARMMDGIIMVVRYGKTPREKISDTIENIGKEKILGVVLNASHERQRDYRYYYQYYHRRRSDSSAQKAGF